MKRALTILQAELYHMVNGDRILGAPSDIRGDLSECEITEEDRKKGIDIKDLIK